MNSLEEFFPVVVFIFVSVLFTLIAIIVPYILAPRTKGQKTLQTYECGIEPYGSAWIRYGMTYYIYVLIFTADILEKRGDCRLSFFCSEA